MVRFDNYEDGTHVLSGTNIGANPYFGLSFNSGFLAMENNGNIPQYPQVPVVITPKSPPNVGLQNLQTPATIATAVNGQSFSLLQLYLGYLATPGYFNTPKTVTITGYFLGGLVPTCSYSHVFSPDGPDPAKSPPVLVSTPGCVDVDLITIGDDDYEDWYIDDVEVCLL